MISSHILYYMYVGGGAAGDMLKGCAIGDGVLGEMGLHVEPAARTSMSVSTVAGPV